MVYEYKLRFQIITNPDYQNVRINTKSHKIDFSHVKTQTYKTCNSINPTDFAETLTRLESDFLMTFRAFT